MKFLAHLVVATGVLACAACERSEATATAAPDLPLQRVAEITWEPDCPMGEAMMIPTGRDTLWRTRAAAEPLCLFAGAIAWAQHDKQKAAQLYALGMVRRRYDIGRCQAVPAGPLSSLMASVRLGAGDKLREAGIEVGPDQIRPVALDPASYRFRTDHLSTFCEGPVKPARLWPEVQAQMRSELEAVR